MRILIVDDEPHVREAIPLLIDGDRFTVDRIDCADNGEAALSMIEKEPPDVLFCDMRMPVMDGVQLLTLLRGRGFHTQIIAVSGYSDYQYVRATLLSEGVDYLLKPLSRAALNDALARAAENLEKQRALTDGRETHEKTRLEMDYRLAREALEEVGPLPPDMLDAFARLGLGSGAVSVGALLLKDYGAALLRFGGDFGHLGQALETVIRRETGSMARAIAYDEDRLFWVVLTSGPANAMGEGCFARACAVIPEETGVELLRIPVWMQAETAAIPGCVRQAKEAAQRVRIHGGGAPDSPARADCSLFDRDLAIIAAARRGSLRQLEEILDSFCVGLLAGGTVTMGDLQGATGELNMILTRLHRAEGRYEVEKKALVSQYIADLSVWKRSALDRLAPLAARGRDDAFQPSDIDLWLREHYAENIRVSDIADAFFLSQQHIARLFKARYHTSIMAALGNIRIARAKALLTSTDWTVGEVARAVGYEDEHYFGKVFKRETGASPAQWRNIVTQPQNRPK